MAIGQGLMNTLKASRRKLDWFTTSKGMIRARRKAKTKGKAKLSSETFCPLTGAAFAATGKKYTLGNTEGAAEVLNISDDLQYDEVVGEEFSKSFISAVIEAADGKTKQPKLRARILRAVGLAS